MKKRLSSAFVVLAMLASCFAGVVTVSADGNFAGGINNWTVDGEGTASTETGTIVAEGTVRVYQTVTDLEPGTYNLTAQAYTSDIAETGTSYLYAKTTGHTVASTAIPEATTDNGVYKIVVPSIVVGEDGICDIGLNLEGSAQVTIDNLAFEKTEDTRVKFYKGGEISKLSYIESHQTSSTSVKFKRSDGEEADALQIMAENGFNLARIRLLDDPGPGHGQKNTGDTYPNPTGWYLPKGYMTEEDCLKMARRAKDKGMDILFSFAYSDYWVDGDKQMMPAAWKKEITDQGLTGEAMYQYLEDKTYSYTKKVMEDLAAQGTTPEFVSIGNEIQVGMYFGQRGDTDNYYDDLYNKPDMLKRFLKAGAKAVREVSPETKIVFHSDNGGKVSKRSTFMNVIKDSSMSEYFDVIGVSYYPFYNDKGLSTKQKTSIDNVVSEFATLINSVDKDVIIMETGYNWAELRGDGYEGQLADSGYYQDTYGESKDGQRAFLTELYAKLKTVLGGRCIGDLYWDPIMLYDGGNYTIGWAINDDGWTEGNVVSNSTIFDFSGKAVPGQLAMKYNTESSDMLNISGKIKSGTAAAANKEVTFAVNGREYTRTTDKYGDYIVSVPYPEDGKVRVWLKGSNTTYVKDAPTYEGILISGCDFDDYGASEVRDFMFKTSVGDDGKISYEAHFVKSDESDVLWAALYSGGRLVEVKRAQSGEFAETAQSGKTYNLKVMLWKENGEPIYADGADNLMTDAE